MEIDKLI